MGSTGLTVLVEAGEQLFTIKLFITAMHCLWVYDYFLTLGDEITYAWNGKKSWAFALFIANRYSPVFYIICYAVLTHLYIPSFCEHTKWLPPFHTTLVAALSEVAIMLRVYAVTEKERWVAGALSCLIAAQFFFGIYLAAWIAARPTPQLPAIDLDPFKFCVSQSWNLGELVFINIAVAFDVLAFLSILIAAKKPSFPRYPGIPNLLDAILRDATIYFVLMFLCQVLFDVFVAFVSSPTQAFPGLAATVLIPMMASRLMLSLKKTAMESAAVWSPSNPNIGMSMEHRSMRFASGVPRGADGVFGRSIPPSLVEDGLGLELTSQSSRKYSY